MASMTIPNMDEVLTRRLVVRAASHGRSIEEEARDILSAALSVNEPHSMNLAETIRARLPKNGVEFEAQPREAIRSAPDFGDT
ncbi:bifunctional SbtC-like/phosphopantothenoylcysteine decarboxylase/phosphopantothenate synthase [Agrobacterium sp. DSM 25558]|uniref:FitA-like ribbon-helix-helix domain-containing protein n=1 Tax=Agrobacterium sp. DSM 25558 TaxID=1907665 RepID=UPI000972495F|nr:plasmid stabilization protein [Agrobacterium sp. DSM 25558]SCX13210.1 bifunctional SbtC-like/phosphopantothenoylcysteine decarboxylase/phosphopantothenate synthase [Agrobacterium sp. DSM 25558]